MQNAEADKNRRKFAGRAHKICIRSARTAAAGNILCGRHRSIRLGMRIVCA